MWWQVDADAGHGLGPDAAVGRRVARAAQHHAAAVLQVYAYTTHETRTVPSKLPQTSTHFAESIPANALTKLAWLVQHERIVNLRGLRRRVLRPRHNQIRLARAGRNPQL